MPTVFSRGFINLEGDQRLLAHDLQLPPGPTDRVHALTIISIGQWHQVRSVSIVAATGQPPNERGSQQFLNLVLVQDKDLPHKRVSPHVDPVTHHRPPRSGSSQQFRPVPYAERNRKDLLIHNDTWHRFELQYLFRRHQRHILFVKQLDAVIFNRHLPNHYILRFRFRRGGTEPVRVDHQLHTRHGRDLILVFDHGVVELMHHQHLGRNPHLCRQFHQPLLGEGDVGRIDLANVVTGNLAFPHGELGIDREVHVRQLQPGSQSFDLGFHRAPSDLYIKEEKDIVGGGELGILVQYIGRRVEQIAPVGLRLRLRDRCDHFEPDQYRARRIGGFVLCRLFPHHLQHALLVVFAQNAHFLIAGEAIEGQDTVFGQKPIRGQGILLGRFIQAQLQLWRSGGNRRDRRVILGDSQGVRRDRRLARIGLGFTPVDHRGWRRGLVHRGQLIQVSLPLWARHEQRPDHQHRQYPHREGALTRQRSGYPGDRGSNAVRKEMRTFGIWLWRRHPFG